MSNGNRNRAANLRAATVAARGEDRNDELLEAVAAAGALVACADGRIAQAERDALVAFVESNGFLFALSRAQILEALERGLRQFRDTGGAKAALDRIARFAGRAPARLLIEASRQIAVADGYLHAGEIHCLQRIHIALGAPSLRSLRQAGGPA
jgi:tellurite resistance protein